MFRLVLGYGRIGGSEAAAEDVKSVLSYPGVFHSRFQAIGYSGVDHDLGHAFPVEVWGSTGAPYRLSEPPHSLNLLLGQSVG
jgi:hypothetical protein